ncbi:hypothetical protein GCM10009765_04210 [Fodinicola feengrottensis]|uniref:Secreted protein n=1 Tax=Fodinicola feengrottensis TaxID=435914 RepID=A0ABN2FS55_9ACTN
MRTARLIAATGCALTAVGLCAATAMPAAAAEQTSQAEQVGQSGVHLQIVKATIGPNGIGPGSCSDASAIGFLTGVETGAPWWYCFSGHGTLNEKVSDVSEYKSSYGAAGQFTISFAPGYNCQTVRIFYHNNSEDYSPAVNVCQITLD